MRCKFCGSKAIYPYTQHEQATAGRVVAGAIIAGAIGAAAGLAGKNVKGYRCSACGMFSEQPMDFGEEMLINSAVSDAKNGKTVIYERYQEKYANLEFVPVRQVVKQESALLSDEDYDEDDVELLPEAEPVDESIKHSYCPNQYVVGSPVFISNVTIKDDNGTDVLLLEVNNISGKTLRSVYLNITVYDDVGDQIGTSTFAFQGLSAATGEQLPQAKPFSLNTNVAYKVNVVCEKAAFTDDTVWRKEENPTIYSVPEKTELVPESFAQHKYLRVLLAKKGALRVGQKLYYPVVEETHRLCVCGNPAVNGSKCLACGLSEADLQEVMDYDVLIQCRKDVIAKTAKERTEALHSLLQQVQEDKYKEAIRLKTEDTQASCAAAIEIFTSMSGYKDADSLCAACKDRIEKLKVQAEIDRKDRIYAAGKACMTNRAARVENFTAAIAEFKKIPGWKDADEQIAICQQKIEELKAQEEADRKERERKAEIARAEAAVAAKRKKVTIAIVAVAVCVAIAFLVVLNTIIIPNGKYNDAIALMESGKYSDAISAFEALDGYKDSAAMVLQCKYSNGIKLMEAKKYEDAIVIFEELCSYNDSHSQYDTCLTAILDAKYNNALVLMEAGKTVEAAMAFGALGDFKDAREQSFRLWDSFAIRDTIATGYYTVGLRADGTVVAVGQNEDGECNVGAWSNIIAISGGSGHTVGLKSNGTVVAVGANHAGQCNVEGWTDIVAISANAGITLGLKSDGTVVATGNDMYGNCDVSDWSDIVAISANSHSVGLKADGTVVAVGNNAHGQCNVSGWTDIVAVSAGDRQTVGIKADGTVVAVGDNRSNECSVGSWHDIVAIDAEFLYTIGLKSDGSVAWTGRIDHFEEIRDWTDISTITAGSFTIVGIKKDGTIVAAGENDYGQCNVSDWTGIRLPNE